MKREKIIRLFEENNIIDFQLKNEKDLMKVFGIDTKKIEGFDTLSDKDKLIFNDFIITFYNIHGIDAKLSITPESIYFVEEFESIITDSEEDFYILPYEYRLTALDKDNKPIKILIHKKNDEYKESKIEKTNLKSYLRFTYIYDYEEQQKKEWLHIENNREWY